MGPLAVAADVRPSRRGLAVAALVVLLVLFVGLPAVLATDARSYDPGDCTDAYLVLYESSESPGEVNVSEDGVGSYRNLSAAERDLVDRALDAADARAAMGWNPYERQRFLPNVLVRGDAVYRTSYDLEGCPLAEGVPPAFNPVLRPMFAVSRVLRGPLAVGLFLVAAVVGARWLTDRLQY
jgi:hypothetical protein